MASNNCDYEYSDDFFADDDESPSLEDDSAMDKDEDIMCAQDIQECSDGSFVSRDPANGCEFPACPSDDYRSEDFDEEEIYDDIPSMKEPSYDETNDDER